MYTLLTPTTTFFKGNLVGKIGEVGVSRVYIKGKDLLITTAEIPRFLFSHKL